jgi:hypothetical protein
MCRSYGSLLTAGYPQWGIYFGKRRAMVNALGQSVTLIGCNQPCAERREARVQQVLHISLGSAESALYPLLPRIACPTTFHNSMGGIDVYTGNIYAPSWPLGLNELPRMST